MNDLKKNVIKLIGDLGITHLSIYPEIQHERLMQIANFYPIDNIDNILAQLIADGFVTLAENNANNKEYTLTRKGNDVYDALNIQSGLLMPLEYQDIGMDVALNIDINPEKLMFVEAFCENWMGNLVHWLGDPLYKNNALENNLFFCYLATQTATFDWLSHSLIFGSYDIVLRELRTILEGMFLAYNLDLKNPALNLENKLLIMEKLEKQGKGHGKAVFRNSGIPNWEEYYQTYRNLCAYVHVSRKVVGEQILKVASEGYIEVLEPSFDVNSFNKCVTLWEEIANAAIDLTNYLLEFVGEKESRVDIGIFY